MDAGTQVLNRGSRAYGDAYRGTACVQGVQNGGGLGDMTKAMTRNGNDEMRGTGHGVAMGLLTSKYLTINYRAVAIALIVGTNSFVRFLVSKASFVAFFALSAMYEFVVPTKPLCLVIMRNAGGYLC